MSRTDKFVNKYKGKIVDVEPGWGYPGECVSLVQRFIIEELGVVAKGRGNGEAWRTALINEGLGYRVPRSEMRKGDIIAWNGKMGHVAIAMDNDRIFEQEGGSKDTRAKFNSAKVWDRWLGNEGLVTRLKNFVDNDGKEDTDISKYSDEELAAMVWRGDFGNGQARIDALGSRWSAVQALVDKGVGKPGSTQKPTTPTTPAKPTSNGKQGQLLVVRKNSYHKTTFTVYKDKALTTPLRIYQMKDFGDLQFMITEDADPIFKVRQWSMTPMDGKVNVGYIKWESGIGFDNANVTPSAPTFKEYKYTIPSGSTLYNANGGAYSAKTTNNHTVTILEEKNGLGRFKASWLVGVSEAWTKIG